MAASDVMTSTAGHARRTVTFAMDPGRPEDDSPTWTDILRAVAVRKRRQEMSPVTAARVLGAAGQRRLP
ncbi:MAG TPA: hypothetical protein VIZ67_09640 [Acidimicrobiales bacterium]